MTIEPTNAQAEAAARADLQFGDADWAAMRPEARAAALERGRRIARAVLTAGWPNSVERLVEAARDVRAIAIELGAAGEPAATMVPVTAPDWCEMCRVLDALGAP